MIELKPKFKLSRRESYLYRTILIMCRETKSTRLPLSEIAARSTIKGRTFSGVYSSLVRKELIETSENGQVKVNFVKQSPRRKLKPGEM
jgi:hypothetical protein